MARDPLKKGRFKGYVVVKHVEGQKEYWLHGDPDDALGREHHPLGFVVGEEKHGIPVEYVELSGRPEGHVVYGSGVRRFLNDPHSMWSERIDPPREPLPVRIQGDLLGKVVGPIRIQGDPEREADLEFTASDEKADDSSAEEQLHEIHTALKRSRELGERAQQGIDALMERRSVTR